jgi:hypothetical protein
MEPRARLEPTRALAESPASRRTQFAHGRYGTIALVVVLLLAFGPVLLSHLALAFDRYAFADDVRVLIFPLFRLEDAALFPNDPIVEYYLASLPLGYRALYTSLAPVFGVIAVERALPFVELALTLFFLAGAAGKLGGRSAILGSIGLVLGSSYFMARMAGGLPRGFVLPLLAAASYFLVLGRARALAVTTVISAGFYPVASVLSGISLAGLLLLPGVDRGSATVWSLRRRVLVLLGTALGVALLVLPTLIAMRAYGEALTPESFARYPEAGEFGRFDPADRPPFPAFPSASLPYLKLAVFGSGAPLFGLLDLRAHPTSVLVVLAVLFVAGLALAARRDASARRLCVLFGALVLGHCLSLLLSPKLFLPERYVAYGVPILVALSLPVALATLGRSVYERFPGAATRFAPAVANLLLLLAVGARGVSGAGVTLRVPPYEVPFYQAIASLPPSSLVAGFPGGAIDNVPYLSRRSALVTRETHMPFHARFTELMRERMRALVHAYFAASRSELVQLRDRFGVTHLLVERHHFLSPPPYFAPFGPEIEAVFRRGKTVGFEIERVVPRARLAEVGGLVLIDLSKL